jgi:hypothetical protein
MELRKFIATTIREYLNEQQEIENNLNDNFWRWFGGSKTIESGKPLKLYHGSSENFSNFKLGYNSYSSFTNNKKLAKSYGSNIYEVYLKIENPYIIDGKGNYIWKFIGEKDSPESFFSGEVPFSYDGIIFKNVIDFNGALGSEYVLDISDVYMVRNPSQIKSIENDGTWDIGDDNIYS